MSDNLELLCISLFSQSESRTHLCHVRICVLQYGRLFGSHVLLNKRWLTVNRRGGLDGKLEGKIATATPLVKILDILPREQIYFFRWRSH